MTAAVLDRPLEVGYNDRLLEKSYEDLLADAEAMGRSLDVPEEVYVLTLGLFTDLRNFDYKTAYETLQALPLTMAAADAFEAMYPDCFVDKGAAWSALLLHDIGKIIVPKWLTDKSNAGLDWTEEDSALMDPHAAAGFLIARDIGLPNVIARPLAESHGKQLGRVYGLNPVLSWQERAVRDFVASGDAAHAAMTRTNSRNAHHTPEDRKLYVYNNNGFIFNDYTQGQELANQISAQQVALLLNSVGNGEG